MKGPGPREDSASNAKFPREGGRFQIPWWRSLVKTDLYLKII